MKKSKLIFCLILYGLLNIMINLIHPLTTTFVGNLSLPDAYFGIFYSLMSLGQVIGAILWGVLSDKIGRKIPICLGIVGYAIGQFGFGFIHVSPLLILFFRFFAGLCISAPNSLFISLILDNYSGNKRIKTLSVFNAFNILGASIGYEIGGSLYEYFKLSIPQVFIIQIVFAFLISTLLFVLLNKEKNPFIHKENGFSNLFTNFGLVPIIFLISLLILTLGQINISKYIDVYTIQNNVFSEATLGHYVLISGLVGFASNILLIPLVKQIKNITSICILIFVLLSSILTFITFNARNANLSIMLYSTHIIYMIAKSCITPLEQAYLGSISSNNDYGKIMGARQSILSIGNVIGPLIGAYIYNGSSPLIFNISSIIIFVSFITFAICFIIQAKKKTQS